MRSVRVVTLILGVALLAGGLVLGLLGSRATMAAAERRDEDLSGRAQNAATLLGETFERARTTELVLANDTAFRLVSTARSRGIAEQRAAIQPIVDALRYVAEVFPGTVDSVGYVDVRADEVARVVAGRSVLPGGLNNVRDVAWFGPARSLTIGEVYRTAPYQSLDTEAWVVTFAAPVFDGDKKLGVVHMELLMDSLRTQIVNATGTSVIRVLDPETGQVILDSRFGQGPGGELGRSADDTFAGSTAAMGSTGRMTAAQERVAYARLSGDQAGLGSTNAAWIVAASAPDLGDPAGARLSLWSRVLGLLGLGCLLLASIGFVRQEAEKRAERERTATERDALSTRLEEMSEALQRVAAGDLATELPVEGFDDERLRRLAVSFESTIDRLRGLVGQAQESRARLTQAAEDLSITSGQQADNARQQAAAVTETTVTIQQLAATAAQISDSAQGVAQTAGQMLQLTEEGRTAVQDSVQAMDRIAGRVDHIAESSVELEERIGEIGRISDLIDELADQTNLLALNAAIEAARAGEHGRGFAVVAAEVRRLAERARQSTAQIQGIVADVQSRTRGTVAASQEGAREVRAGAELAHSAVDALDRIAEMVDDATTAVKEISIATMQQRSASDQVVSAMTGAEEVSRQYASAAAHAALSADELSAVGEELRTTIDRFSVERQDESLQPHA